MGNLLQELTSENMELDITKLIHGSNTDVTPIRVENWRIWNDFTYRTLTRIFKTELEETYIGDQVPEALTLDREMINEETFDDFMRRFLTPTVNYALRRYPYHLGRGSRCPLPGVPDWSVVKEDFLKDGKRYFNLLPGDTKISKKWWPTQIKDGQKIEWQKVVTQVFNYMVTSPSRYGFIVTDDCLVALRLTRCEIGPGMALERPRRNLKAVSYGEGVSWDESVKTDKSDATYKDNDPFQWQYHDLEHAVVKWDVHGEGKLTVKLALWCLAMMAANDNSVNYEYPDLDSWRTVDGGFFHNTSGVFKEKLLKTDKVREPLKPMPESSGPGAGPAQHGDETGEASGTNTRAPVEERTLPYVGPKKPAKGKGKKDHKEGPQE